MYRNNVHSSLNLNVTTVLFTYIIEILFSRISCMNFHEFCDDYHSTVLRYTLDVLRLVFINFLRDYG